MSLVKEAGVLLSSVAVWALVLTSELVTIGGPLSDPAVLLFVATTFVAAHLAVGYSLGRWRALAVSAIPVGVALAVMPWIPESADAPGFTSGLWLVVAMFVAPPAAALLAVGVVLRRQSLRHADA